MDNDRALEIIDALAAGVDPFTGENFQSGGVFQHPDTVRALCRAANALRQESGNAGSATLSRSSNSPGNAGMPWSEAEDQALVAAFEAGGSAKDLAVAHERTRGAIRSRLVTLGKLDRRPNNPPDSN